MWTCSLNEISQIELAPNVTTRSLSVVIFLPCTIRCLSFIYVNRIIYDSYLPNISSIIQHNSDKYTLATSATCCVHCGYSTMCISVRHPPWPCNNMHLEVVSGLVSWTLSSRTWQFTQIIKLSNLSYQSENRKSTLAWLILFIAINMFPIFSLLNNLCSKSWLCNKELNCYI